jgi:hypothetical protein
LGEQLDDPGLIAVGLPAEGSPVCGRDRSGPVSAVVRPGGVAYALRRLRAAVFFTAFAAAFFPAFPPGVEDMG